MSGTYLQPIADTENRYTQNKNLWVHMRSIGVIDRVRRARQDNAYRPNYWSIVLAHYHALSQHTFGFPRQILDLLRAWHEFCVDVEFTASSCDKMAVLDSESASATQCW